MSEQKRAVILVSGGLDSTTVLAMAQSQGYACYTLSFDYGQRHRAELYAADRVSRALGDVEHKLVKLNLDSIGGSALTDMSIAVPEEETAGIPITYVPARNTVFLSIALGWAEVLGAHDIFIGVNAVDYSGYPDCRPEYIAAFETMANLATRAGVEGQKITIHTPLMTLGKGDIILAGIALGVDYAITVSCYQATEEGLACGKCDSCRLRRQGFADTGLEDPTHYLHAL
ncbi:MAG: 7-cyano-7-deazaguanine synthase QueC [Halioglobus sp.]|jgi:7-cyano-7-deazaguanine synthase|tara:strand:- start:855 stop:1541 length:687 start_codon:yes stop_codon:yes gene_type:complete